MRVPTPRHPPFQELLLATIKYGACVGTSQWAGIRTQAVSLRNVLKDYVCHDAPTYEGGHASRARAPDTVAGVPAGQEAMEAGS